ncbi:MAG: DUF58 domain-containing protein [Candidatus Eremiobacteraeota bacterium]|nr:DUF58 domain-containing protein [Candidatus Eremiobacteraeota bacterium]MBV8722392.1 DUF58 domain-containing protein [Candidatus Eremiobacteraeota bacterium]
MTWFTRRFLYLLGGIALLLACAPGLSLFVPFAAACAAALAVATIVDASLGPRRRDLSIVRLLPDHFALRRTAELQYEVTNRSQRALAVGLVESPVRTLRYPEDEIVAPVGPSSVATVARAAIPVARGEDTFGAIFAWYENPLGLLRRRVRIDAPQSFRVFPDLSAVERYGALHVRNRLIEAGLRKMRLRGAGTEFESLREFSPGDPFRSIDWKATARRGKVMVSQYEVERSQNVMLVLDCGRLMTPRVGAQRKFDYAVTAALSLATIAGLADDRVGVVAFAQRILAASAPRSTRSSIAKLTEQLYDLEPKFEEANYARAFAYLRAHLHKRSLVVFLTDVIDPVSQAMLYAELGSLARRHLVVCVFMNDAAVAAALSAPPHDLRSAYRASAALDLLDERKTAAAILTRAGVLVVDVPAAKLTTSLIDEYLRVKQRGLL